MTAPAEIIKQSRELLLQHFKEVGKPASTERTEWRKEHIKTGPGRDSFYLIVNLPEARFASWQCNVQHTIGFSDFTYEAFFNSIHPRYLDWYFQWARGAYELSLEGTVLLSSQEPSYSIHFPLRNKNDGGSYWWVKQISEPFELDDNGRMATHLNTYRMVGPYVRQEPICPLFQTGHKLHKEWQRQVLKLVKDRLMSIWFEALNPAQMNLLKAYLEYANSGAGFPNNAEMADRHSFYENTLLAANKKIKFWGNHNLPVDHFRDAREVAEFLHRLFGSAE